LWQWQRLESCIGNDRESSLQFGPLGLKLHLWLAPGRHRDHLPMVRRNHMPSVN